MASKTMTCILCPLGCRMEAEEITAKPGELRLRGHQCGLGKDYAREEFYHPKRMLTSTVAVRGGFWPRLPVKTATPVPKETLGRVMKEINKVEVSAPVKRGEVIIAALPGCGVSVVATRDMPGQAPDGN